jgi:hypothetical protein
VPSDVVQKRVLLVGKSQAVLASAVALLHDRGYAADSTSSFDGIAAQFDVRHTDLVVFGGQVPEDKREEMKREIFGLNDQVIFVQGLAGIPGLIVGQVEGAFAAEYRTTESTPSYDANQRTINLSLDRARAVTVTAWWQTSFIPPDPLSDSLTLLEEQLPEGERSIALPDVVPQEAAFATVHVDKAVYAFSLSRQR